MGYANLRTFTYNTLNALTGINVYNYPTDEVDYPAVIIQTAESNNIEDRETNQSVLRSYELELEVIVGANPELQNKEDLDRIMAETLDTIIEELDKTENRKAGGGDSQRFRVTRIVPRSIVNPTAKRVATITLELLKYNS